MYQLRWVGLLSICATSLALMMSLANAGEVSGRVVCDKTTKYCLINGLGIKGEIDDTTLASFAQLIEDFNRQRNPNDQSNDLTGTKVRLNSPGGSVLDSMAIGRLLRQHRMTAEVKPGFVCNSACVFIYAGAVAREGHFGKIGIHQPYFEVPQQAVQAGTIKNSYAIMLGDMRSYLREMNVSEQLADEMLRTRSSDIRYLSPDEQDQFGLDTFDPVEREVRDVEQAQKLGLDRREYNRRQALVLKLCPLDSGYAKCYEEVYKTGKEPEPLKPSQYGIPVNN
jgi:ATP-dependent protease ClpP protease subunit